MQKFVAFLHHSQCAGIAMYPEYKIITCFELQIQYRESNTIYTARIMLLFNSFFLQIPIQLTTTIQYKIRIYFSIQFSHHARHSIQLTSICCDSPHFFYRYLTRIPAMLNSSGSPLSPPRLTLKTCPRIDSSRHFFLPLLNNHLLFPFQNYMQSSEVSIYGSFRKSHTMQIQF